MEAIIKIYNQIGKDLRTRSFFRRDIELIIAEHGSNATLDFSGVEFISRSVADEICNLLLDYPSLCIAGMHGNVKAMYDIVVKGRNQPREYPHMQNVKVYHLKTIKEMQDFFDAI